MPTNDELIMLQALPLEIKVAKTKQRIQEWVERYGVDGVYVSFSGGKDSTVLLHIAREMYPSVQGMYVNTGLEYPEIQEFVKSFDNIAIVRPKMRFDEVLKKYRYPLISKEVSECVGNAKKYLIDIERYSYSYRKLMGIGEYSPNTIEIETEKAPQRVQKVFGTLKKKDSMDKSKFNCVKWKPLIGVDFNISNRCCGVMKKYPAHKFARETGKHPMTAQTAEESRLRRQQWLKNGCNGFDMKSPISNPMSFWTEQDILKYIKENNIRIASVYGEIIENENGQLTTTKAKRTGCVFCAYSLHKDKSPTRFEQLKESHPKQYDYCLNGGEYDEYGVWKPNKDGLGMKHVFDETNKIFGDNFIKY